MIKMNIKKAVTDYPIQHALADRWSPYGFEDRPVAEADLCSLFEAARWAASSYNEQPWNYLVAIKENAREFDQLLACLVEANQAWAKAAPVLMISVARKTSTHSGKPNRCAIHDVGLASENMTLEAVEQGLLTHGMGGIDLEKIRQVYGLPENYEAVAGWAIGYGGEPDALEGKLKEAEEAPRARKPLAEFVFNEWGKAADFIG